MKKIRITKKIPIFVAYQWDGSVESFRALAKELKHQLMVEFHVNDELSWLSLDSYAKCPEQDSTTRLYAGQYLVLSDEGMIVLPFPDMLTNRFDIVEEKEVYTGRLQGPLDTWTQSDLKPTDGETGEPIYAKRDRD